MRDRGGLETGLAWRLASSLLPPAFRARYGMDLLDTHIDRAGGPGRSGGVRFWLMLWWDALVTGIEVRLEGSANLGPGVGSVLQEISLSLRRVARQPWFTAAVAVTLGLGIGANVMMFTILDRMLLSPPAGVTGADRVKRVFVHGRSPFSAGRAYQGALSYPDLEGLEQVSGFERIAGHSQRDMTLGFGVSSERVRAEYASASYFDLLGVRPSQGRFYTAAEDEVGAAEPVAVLSWAYWRRRFGSDPGVIGTVLELGRGRYTIVGVGPRGFTGTGMQPTDIWIPLLTAGGIESGDHWRTAWGWYWFAGIVRLPEGMGAEAAESEATAKYVAGRAGQRSADPEARVVLASIVPGRGPTPSSETRVAGALGMVAMLVLLIACANVTNLLLARGIERRRLHAVQSALGMSRLRLMTQLLAEALVLAILGGGLALGLARVAGPWLIGVLLPDAAAVSTVGGRSVVATTLLVTLTTVLVGVLPSWRGSRVDVLEAMRARGSTRGVSAIRRGLLGAQAALSVILLVGAGLFLRSLREATSMDLGIAPGVMSVGLELNDGTSYGEELARPVYELAERFRSDPRVASAAVTSLPLYNGRWALTVELPGNDSLPSGPEGPIFYAAGPGYFDAMGLPVVRGRVFAESDDVAKAPPVAVVNESMARLAWPGRDALGECLLIGSEADSPPCTEIIGVVEDFLPSVTAAAAPVYFLPPHHPGIGFTAAQYILIRPRAEPEAFAGSVRELVRTAAPEVRYAQVSLLSDAVREQMASWRLGATLLTLFGVLALLVAAAGFYSVVAFDVAQRRQELGIRSALGASSGRLLRVVLTRALAVTVAGIALGVVASLAAGRLVESLLFHVSARDPAVFGAVCITLVGAALIAGTIPALRAARVDPVTALREE